MQVILLEKVKNLGELGDTVKVKPGFARNFLIPGNKAVAATEANIAQFEARRAELEQQQAEAIAAARSRAEKLEGLTVTLQRKAGDSGKLFGSIGAADVAEVVSQQSDGVTVVRQEVQLPGDSIRQVGNYPIHLTLHADVGVDVTLVVEPDA
ncbi:MAG: 50S ribosomal protein L9 [Gammaproteobacteria bacterium]|nr:50S ribosomal protein L9 [Gammaproteobacteria bacterium]